MSHIEIGGWEYPKRFLNDLIIILLLNCSWNNSVLDPMKLFKCSCQRRKTAKAQCIKKTNPKTGQSNGRSASFCFKFASFFSCSIIFEKYNRKNRSAYEKQH